MANAGVVFSVTAIGSATALLATGAAATSETAGSRAEWGGLPDSSIAAIAAQMDVAEADVRAFTLADANGQLQLLEEAGLSLPEGVSLDSPGAGRYLMGRWLERTGDERAAAEFLLTSGLLAPAEAAEKLAVVAAEPAALRQHRASDEIIAADLGWSVEDTSVRLDTQALVALLRSQVRTLTPGSYGGIWIDHQEHSMLVGLTAAPSAEVIDLLDASGVSYELAIVPASRASIEAASERVGAEARSFGGQISVSPDVRSGTLTVQGTSSDLLALDGAGLEDVASEFSSQLRVELVATTEREEATSTNRGGVRLDPMGMTAGFVYWQHGSTGTGILSAGHETTNGPAEYLGNGCEYSFWADIVGAGKDAALYDNDNCGLNENEVNISVSPYVQVITSVRDQGDMEQDDVICHQGDNTGYDCGTIDNPSYNSTNIGSPAIRTFDNYVADVGDSGGPAFDGSVALGLQSQKITSGSTYLGAIVSPVSLTESFFGLEVLDK